MRTVLLLIQCLYLRTQCIVVHHEVSSQSVSEKPSQWEIVKGRAQRKKSVPAEETEQTVPSEPAEPVESIDTADAVDPAEPHEALESETSVHPLEPTEALESETIQLPAAIRVREPNGAIKSPKPQPKLDGVSLGNLLSPYTPQPGWKYHLEAGWSQAWPQCEKRFVSHTPECGKLDLSYIFEKQLFEFEETTGQGFYIKTSCGTYLSYSSNCSNHKIDSWTTAGIKQEFEFVRAEQQIAWNIKAVGRTECKAQWVSFPTDCEAGKDKVSFLLQSSPGLGFRLHPNHQTKAVHRKPVTSHTCADPFAWYAKDDDSYHLLCTGGNFRWLRSDNLGSHVQFEPEGAALARQTEVPEWAMGGERWAAETTEFGEGENSSNILFFSVDQRDEDYKHRIGWAVSNSHKPKPGSYTYGNMTLNLGGEAGGDVDQSVFKDDSGKVYLVWKTDDEWIGSKTTRIWAQQISWDNNEVVLVGARDVLMDSGGLWWINGITQGSTIIEAPVITKQNGFYYLFYSAGFFCTSHYSEGVARSESFWGPYDKLQVPFISTGLIGQWGEKKMLGPGHATFLQDNRTGDHFVLYHAHFKEDDHCAGNSKHSGLSVLASRQMRDSGRYSFIERMGFTSDGWPYIQSC